MSGDHYRCPVPGEDGVRAGDGGRLGAMLRAGARGMHADEAAVEPLAVPRPPRRAAPPPHQGTVVSAGRLAWRRTGE